MPRKVLIVDDSALMRRHLREILAGAGWCVETARHGREGLEKAAAFEPDVVTLDVNMPVMDGLTCLSELMVTHPCPVVMVSSLTEKGALATFEALELGAVDYVAKPGGTVSLDMERVAGELLQKVTAAAGARIARPRRPRSGAGAPRHRKEAPACRTPGSAQGDRHGTAGTGGPASGARPGEPLRGLVLVGVSTGGPGTLERIVEALPPDFPLPMVVAQHMPARFTEVFAERLDRSAAIAVREVTGVTALEAGTVYIARGDADVRIIRRAGRLRASTVPSDTRYGWHPSVERMVESAGEACEPRDLICVQLTGMGNDGARAMAALHARGARTIAESEATAVVYGMPRELVALGGADEVLPATRIAACLERWAQRPIEA